MSQSQLWFHIFEIETYAGSCQIGQTYEFKKGKMDNIARQIVIVRLEKSSEWEIQSQL